MSMKRWTESRAAREARESSRLSMREGSLAREVKETGHDYVPLAEVRAGLPPGRALCRRCLKAEIPDTRYLCVWCKAAVNRTGPDPVMEALGLGTMPEVW